MDLRIDGSLPTRSSASELHAAESRRSGGTPEGPARSAVPAETDGPGKSEIIQLVLETIRLENLTASGSDIENVDSALDLAALARHQILDDAGTSILAHTKITPQFVLQLLQ